MPDLDQIKQAEQGVRDRRAVSPEAGRATPSAAGSAAATRGDHRRRVIAQGRGRGSDAQGRRTGARRRSDRVAVPSYLSFRPRRFSWSCATARGGRGAARSGFAAPSRRALRSSRREPPVDRHADRDCGDAERHRRAGDAFQPVELGGDDDERQHEAGAEHQQCGLGIAHALQPWNEAPILPPSRCRDKPGSRGGGDTR